MWTAARVPGGSGWTAHAYREDFIRDHNDNIIAIRVDDTDNLDGDASMIVHASEYDILNQKVATIADVGGLNIRKEITWGPTGDRTKVVYAAGSPDELTQQWTFDERHFWISKTLGTDQALSLIHI